MESRASRLRLFAEPAAVATSERVRVRVQADASTAGWIGALVVEGAPPLEREVRGERCEDVVLALALITVLRLEPNREPEARAAAPPGVAALAATGATSTTGPSATSATAAASAVPATYPTTPSAPSRTSSAAPSAATTAAAAASVVTASSVSAAAPAEPTTSALEPPETSPAPVAPSRAVAGAAGVVALGPDALRNGALAPQAAAAHAGASQSAASEAAAQAASGVQTPADATAVLSDSGSVELSNAPPLLLEPALAAYVGYASAPSHAFQAVLRGEARFAPGRAAWAAAGSLAYGHSGQQNPAGDLGFDSLLAGLSLCPPGLTLRLGIWLHACAEARGGALWVAVSARELPLETGATLRPWLELGPSLQLGLPLSSRWTLRALSSLTLLLMRDSFDVERVVVDEDGQEQSERFTLYRPPVASLQLLLGIGYEL